MTEQPTDTDLTGDHRRRLLRAVGDAVAEKGYAATTVNDIVARARISKRTFYEHYTGKSDCFLESYRRGSNLLHRRMTEAGMAVQGPPEVRFRAAFRGFLAVLEEYPASTRTFALEILSAGPTAIELRREKHRRLAQTLLALVDDVRRTETTLRPLSRVGADSVVGAMTELILNGLADGRPGELADLDVPMTELLMALLTAPPLTFGPPAP